jgi:hypothetical protein
MRTAKPPDPANLIVGAILSDELHLECVRAALEKRFGRIDDQSELIPFSFTSYYEPEMGSKLFRCWLSFAELRQLDALAEAKLATNAMESSWRLPDGRRQVNLDPGLLTMHNFVLATTKNFAHRVYLGKGIFAEVTLLYEHGRFQALKWTYPDYQSGAATDFLVRVRSAYLAKLGGARRESGMNRQDA